ncbi:putative Sporulation domain protein [Beijerinckiaceae bacterium RH AL1]|nr:putative Sporulation domain protein [Beijerinckiaceae bacterium RH CH11]VVB45424.1 putative Sporulation domain protein [Beijerinckiaceae bacterium RH AL8]VVC54819.1 putative Sporulation domain protein [Beijerinckiaceae bacterium RH AL1]
MSETVARQRPPVDLDDFERRFRQTQRPAHHEDDPLAELARIVGDEPDPYGDVFAQQAPPAHPAPDFRPSFAPHARQEPSFGDAGAQAAKPRFLADFAAIEAGLRNAATQPPHFHQEPQFGQQPQFDAHPQFAPGHDTQADYAEPDYAFPPEPQAQADWAEQPRPAKKRAVVGLKPAYAIAGSIAIAVVGIGVAFAYKGVGSSPREIKTIMAAAGPTKVQPPADAKDAGDQAASGQSQATPTKLVSREEQPVDLQQAVQDNAARDAASRGTDAASVPVPGQGEGTMSPDYSTMGGAKTDTTAAAPAAQQPYSDQGFGVGMPLPKKVKSVMVKPDGTIVSGAQDAAPAAPQAAAPATDSIGALVGGAAPAAATPKAHAKGAKATARVATAAPTPAAEPADGADAPPVAAKPGKKTKPVKVAKAETGTETEAATDAGDDAKPAAGTFAVQLGAPGSEAEARSATARFLKKYAGALHGQRLGFHRADSNGKTVYRIRVSSLSKADAASLCSKLKADGGTCFIAKN